MADGNPQLRRTESGELTRATVMYREVARIGSRVKHYGQQYTSYSTATVTGFKNVGSEARPWIKVLVDHDSDKSVYAFPDGWDWDRTEVIR